jgi:hypothetical protein
MLSCLVLGSDALAKKDYWEAKCPRGTQLEQNGEKLEFRCRKGIGEVTEYKAGRCKRPTRLARSGEFGYSHGCRGTTIHSKGDVGTSETWAMYECPAGYEVNRAAKRGRETCFRKVNGAEYSKPEFDN